MRTIRAASYVAMSGLCVTILAGCGFARVSDEDLEPIQPRVASLYPEATEVYMYSANHGEGLTDDTVEVVVYLDDLKKYDEAALDKIRELLTTKFPENPISIDLSFPSAYNSDIVTYAEGAYTEDDLASDTNLAVYAFGGSPYLSKSYHQPGFTGGAYYQEKYVAHVEFEDYQVTGEDLYNYVSALEDLPLYYGQHQVVFSSDKGEGDRQDIANAEGVEARKVGEGSYCLDFGKGEYFFTEYEQTLHVVYWDGGKCSEEPNYVPSS